MKRLKGLYKDSLPIDQPEGTYRHAENAVLNLDVGSVSSERGFKRTGANLPANHDPIGYVPLSDGRIVVFSCTDSDSAIGVFDGTSYTAIHNNPVLNFKQSHPVTGTFKVSEDGDYKVYFTDGLNPPRVVNIDTPIDLAISDINELNIFDYIPNVSNIVVDKVLNSSGSLLTGSYVLCIRYRSPQGRQTNFFSFTKPISIFKDSEGDVAQGEVLSATTKAIQFSINNLDQTYSYFDLAVIHYSEGTIKDVRLIRDYPVSTTSIVYTGNESYEPSSFEQVVANKAHYSTADTITQADDTLYLGGLTKTDEIDYQPYAMNIKTELITGLPGDSSDSGSDTYDAADIIYYDKSFKRGEVYAFYISFTKKDGTETRAFHIPGRQSEGIETDSAVVADAPEGAKNFHLFSLPGTNGLSYWENVERYPDEDRFGSDRNTPVRHVKFPDEFYVPFPATLGIKFSNIIIPPEIADQVTSAKIYYAEKTHANSLVIDQATSVGQMGMDNEGRTSVFNYVDYNDSPILAPHRNTGAYYIGLHAFNLLRTKKSLSGISYLKHVANAVINSHTPNSWDGGSLDDRVTYTLAKTRDPVLPTYKKVEAITYIESNMEETNLLGSDFNITRKLSDREESQILVRTNQMVFIPFSSSIGDTCCPIFDLYSYKTDVHNSFDKQNLVWTGYSETQLGKFVDGSQDFSTGTAPSTDIVIQEDAPAADAGSTSSGSLTITGTPVQPGTPADASITILEDADAPTPGVKGTTSIAVTGVNAPPEVIEATASGGHVTLGSAADPIVSPSKPTATIEVNSGWNAPPVLPEIKSTATTVIQSDAGTGTQAYVVYGITPGLTNGNIQITYDGNPVTVTLTDASNAEIIGDEIVSAVNFDGTIQVTAAHDPVNNHITFTEKRTGSAHNSKQVMFSDTDSTGVTILEVTNTGMHDGTDGGGTINVQVGGVTNNVTITAGQTRDSIGADIVSAVNGNATNPATAAYDNATDTLTFTAKATGTSGNGVVIVFFLNDIDLSVSASPITTANGQDAQSGLWGTTALNIAGSGTLDDGFYPVNVNYGDTPVSLAARIATELATNFTLEYNGGSRIVTITGNYDDDYNNVPFNDTGSAVTVSYTFGNFTGGTAGVSGKQGDIRIQLVDTATHTFETQVNYGDSLATILGNLKTDLELNTSYTGTVAGNVLQITPPGPGESYNAVISVDLNDTGITVGTSNLTGGVDAVNGVWNTETVYLRDENDVNQNPPFILSINYGDDASAVAANLAALINANADFNASASVDIVNIETANSTSDFNGWDFKKTTDTTTTTLDSGSAISSGVTPIPAGTKQEDLTITVVEPTTLPVEEGGGTNPVSSSDFTVEVFIGETADQIAEKVKNEIHAYIHSIDVGFTATRSGSTINIVTNESANVESINNRQIERTAGTIAVDPGTFLNGVNSLANPAGTLQIQLGQGDSLRNGTVDVNYDETPASVASKIADLTFTGYTVSAVGNTVNISSNGIGSDKNGLTVTASHVDIGTTDTGLGGGRDAVNGACGTLELIYLNKDFTEDVIQIYYNYGDTADQIAAKAEAAPGNKHLVNVSASGSTVTVTSNLFTSDYNGFTFKVDSVNTKQTYTHDANGIAQYSISSLAFTGGQLDGGIEPSNNVSTFGGDTFMVPFGVRITGLNYYDSGGSVQSPDVVFRRLRMYMVESKDNIILRQTGSNLGEFNPNMVEDDQDIHSILYVEQVRGDGLSREFYSDNYYGYDQSHSQPANFKASIPYSKTDIIPNTYPTRIIRSTQENLEDNLDNFLTFLDQDYLDLSKNRGKITRLDVLNNILFIHTGRSLYRTKGREELVTQDFRAFLGAGDIFQVKPTEEISSPTGYAGCQYRHAGITSEYGYFFVDMDSRKVFLQSDKLIPVSEAGMRNFFQEELTWHLEEYGVDPNTNPYLFVHVGYDPVMRRFFVTKQDYKPTASFISEVANRTYDSGTGKFSFSGTPVEYTNTNYFTDEGFTVSYMPEIQAWVSFHSYIPQLYLSDIFHVYSVNPTGTGFYKHNEKDYLDIEDYCKYYGDQYSFHYQFVDNRELSVNKQVMNLEYEVEAFAHQPSPNTWKTNFNRFRIRNDRQDTGFVPITYFKEKGNARNIQGTWRINKFRDAIDPTTGTIAALPWYKQKRFIGKYALVDLYYDNPGKVRLALVYATMNSKPHIR